MLLLRQQITSTKEDTLRGCGKYVGDLSEKNKNGQNHLIDTYKSRYYNDQIKMRHVFTHCVINHHFAIIWPEKQKKDTHLHECPCLEIKEVHARGG